MKITRLFLCSAGMILLLTAVAKFIASTASTRILQISDPILMIPFRQVFWIVGAVELSIALVCFFGKRVGLQAGLVAWLSTGFAIYRLGLIWIGWQKPCSCLGNLTDALDIPPQVADTAMKIILGYLLIGSYAVLLWLWVQKKAVSLSVPRMKVSDSRS